MEGWAVVARARQYDNKRAHRRQCGHRNPLASLDQDDPEYRKTGENQRTGAVRGLGPQHSVLSHGAQSEGFYGAQTIAERRAVADGACAGGAHRIHHCTRLSRSKSGGGIQPGRQSRARHGAQNGQRRVVRTHFGSASVSVAAHRRHARGGVAIVALATHPAGERPGTLGAQSARSIDPTPEQ